MSGERLRPCGIGVRGTGTGRLTYIVRAGRFARGRVLLELQGDEGDRDATVDHIRGRLAAMGYEEVRS